MIVEMWDGAVPNGPAPLVQHRFKGRQALAALTTQEVIEKKRYAACDRDRPGSRTSADRSRRTFTSRPTCRTPSQWH